MSLQAFHENQPELPLTVLSGDLFVGNKKLPIASFSDIPEANKIVKQCLSESASVFNVN